jgi:hypothetical protein
MSRADTRDRDLPDGLTYRCVIVGRVVAGIGFMMARDAAG